MNTLKPPSDDQVQNVLRMNAILSANWRARLLAQSLWEFYSYRLYCTVRDYDGKPNTYHIAGMRGPNEVGDIGISISVRQDERQEEALVHELLHANLIPLGYPRFWINDDRESEEYRRAGGVINLADHKVMRPIFLWFGYSADRFLGPSRPLDELETRIDAHLEAIKSTLSTPAGYLLHVGACLADHSVSFEPIDLASSILDRFAT